MEALTEQVAALTDAMATNEKTFCQPARLLCLPCNQPGHVQHNCPRLRRCFNRGRIGHLKAVNPLCSSVNSYSNVVVAAVRTQESIVNGVATKKQSS